jgi:hypothetical protein
MSVLPEDADLRKNAEVFHYCFNIMEGKKGIITGQANKWDGKRIWEKRGKQKKVLQYEGKMRKRYTGNKERE